MNWLMLSAIILLQGNKKRTAAGNAALTSSLVSGMMPSSYRAVGAVLATERVEKEAAAEVDKAEVVIATESANALAAALKPPSEALPELEKVAPRLFAVAKKHNIAINFQRGAITPVVRDTAPADPATPRPSAGRR